MEFTTLQKEYIKKQLSINKGSQTAIAKSDILDFAKSVGLDVKKSCTKESALDLIYNTGNENKLFEEFAHKIDVPYFDVAKLNELTYKQLSELEQYEVITKLEYTGWKDSTLYPLSVLGFDEGELLKIWNDKNKTNFHRTRIDIACDDEIENIINELSKVFEIQHVSKPYPHRDNDGYYIYLSMRPLNSPINNDNYKNEENIKLKIINSIEADVKETETYKSIKDKLNSHKERIRDADVYEYKIDMLEKKIDYLEKMNAELKENIKTTSGGRPQKFNDQDKETMKMYRLQGKSIRYIAKAFECSTGLVHKIVSK